MNYTESINRSQSELVGILIVDDHCLFSEGLERLLEPESHLKVIARCASIKDGLQVLRSQSIDLVLLDFDLGNENAQQFLIDAREIGFRGRVLIVTGGMQGNEVREVLKQGVSGIFLKHRSPELLTQVIHQIADGQMWIDQLYYLKPVLDSALSGQQQDKEPGLFTERESEVLKGILEGLSNKEIASFLHLSESSVKTIIQTLFAKTGFRTRGQLVRVALDQGYKRLSAS